MGRSGEEHYQNSTPLRFPGVEQFLPTAPPHCGVESGVDFGDSGVEHSQIKSVQSGVLQAEYFQMG